MQRQCTKCGEVKPLTEFTRTPSGKTSHKARCKDCERETLREWRRVNPAKRAAQNRRARPDAAARRVTYQRKRVELNASHREWYAANRERQVAYSIERTKAWRLAHPHEARMLGRVWRAVQLAITRGDLVHPLECEACGVSGVPIDAAHYDYQEPLRVRWLCRSCHSRWDLAEPKLRLVE